MDTYDLETAFFKRLNSLAFSGGHTYQPDEIVPEKNQPAKWRRGVVIPDAPETVGFGNGVYSRLNGLYQIDLYIDRCAANALKVLKKAADAHVTHFFPVNGRGLTVTEQQTSAHIVRRPNQRPWGREGGYLREIVEIYFYVEIPAVG